MTHEDPNQAKEADCLYCGLTLVGDEISNVPDENDDEAWEAIQARHAESCEWAQTRAHRA